MIERAAFAQARGDQESAECFLLRAANLEARYPAGGEIRALLQNFQRERDH